MSNLHLVVMVAAFVCFLISTLQPGVAARLIPAGLALWVASTFLI